VADDGTSEKHGGDRSAHLALLIPLFALAIPITAVVGDSPMAGGAAVAIVVAAVAFAARILMRQRHVERLAEIAAHERLAIADRERIEAIDRAAAHGVDMGRFEPDTRPTIS
jgi:hypothetical protein